jgi:hypothetical protein
MITDPRELYRFLAAPRVEVVNLIVASDDALVFLAFCRGRKDTEFTSHQRKHLSLWHDRRSLPSVQIPESAEERALYCDTDSFLYIQEESEPRLVECGNNLGDMTNELKPGEYTDELVSGGPKNYAYKIYNKDVRSENLTLAGLRGVHLSCSVVRVSNEGSWEARNLDLPFAHFFADWNQGCPTSGLDFLLEVLDLAVGLQSVALVPQSVVVRTFFLLFRFLSVHDG